MYHGYVEKVRAKGYPEATSQHFISLIEALRTVVNEAHTVYSAEILKNDKSEDIMICQQSVATVENTSWRPASMTSRRARGLI